MLKTKIPELLPSLFLVVNSITWFSLTWFAIRDLLVDTPFNQLLLVSSSYFGALILSAVVGATLLKKRLEERKTQLSWILLGSLACVLSGLLAPDKNSPYLIPVAMSLGALSGLGIPTCLRIFADSFSIKRRGILAASVFFFIQLATFLIYVPVSTASLGIQFFALGAWRLTAAVSMLFFKSLKKPEQERPPSLLNIVREKTFYLYFVPWFLFTIVNFVEQPLLAHYFGPELYNTYTLALILIFSVSAFLGGAICDFRGRKVAGILGFMLLGLGYGFLSLFPGTMAQILYVLFDGIAWGILYVTFIFVVWGDISEERNRERYYVLGCMPFLFSNLIEALVEPSAANVQIEMSFSFASLFLFLAILPLVIAPETLPEKVMKERELKTYLQKAQEIAAKAQEKKAEAPDKEDEPEESDVEFEVAQEDAEEAEKLAEKYY